MRARDTFSGVLVALVIVLGCGRNATAPMASDCPLPSGDPFCAMNQAFLDAYGRERSAIVARLSPVIVQVGDRLILFRNGRRSERPAVTPRYHEYKSISHTALAVFALLRSHVDSALDETTLHELELYRELVRQGQASLGGRGFSPEALDLHGRILERSLALIGQGIVARSVTRDALVEFARKQARDVLLSTKMAAHDQIDTTDQQISAWKREMSPEEIASMRAVVSVGHMPGSGNIGAQYFSALLGQHYEGRFEVEDVNDRVRVVTQEAQSEPEGLKLLGTHLLDGEVGVAFFGDFTRMHRDLLADAAEEILVEKFGKAPDAP